MAAAEENGQQQQDGHRDAPGRCMKHILPAGSGSCHIQLLFLRRLHANSLSNVCRYTTL
jgi:hypothetical protein